MPTDLLHRLDATMNHYPPRPARTFILKLSFVVLLILFISLNTIPSSPELVQRQEAHLEQYDTIHDLNTGSSPNAFTKTMKVLLQHLPARRDMSSKEDGGPKKSSHCFHPTRPNSPLVCPKTSVDSASPSHARFSSKALAPEISLINLNARSSEAQETTEDLEISLLFPRLNERGELCTTIQCLCIADEQSGECLCGYGLLHYCERATPAIAAKGESSTTGNDGHFIETPIITLDSKQTNEVALDVHGSPSESIRTDTPGCRCPDRPSSICACPTKQTDHIYTEGVVSSDFKAKSACTRDEGAEIKCNCPVCSGVSEDRWDSRYLMGKTSDALAMPTKKCSCNPNTNCNCPDHRPDLEIHERQDNVAFNFRHSAVTKVEQFSDAEDNSVNADHGAEDNDLSENWMAEPSSLHHKHSDSAADDNVSVELHSASIEARNYCNRHPRARFCRKNHGYKAKLEASAITEHTSAQFNATIPGIHFNTTAGAFNATSTNSRCSEKHEKRCRTQSDGSFYWALFIVAGICGVLLLFTFLLGRCRRRRSASPAPPLFYDKTRSAPPTSVSEIQYSTIERPGISEMRPMNEDENDTTSVRHFASLDGASDGWTKWLQKHQRGGKSTQARALSPTPIAPAPRIPTLRLPQPTLATMRKVGGLGLEGKQTLKGKEKNTAVKWNSTV